MTAGAEDPVDPRTDESIAWVRQVPGPLKRLRCDGHPEDTCRSCDSTYKFRTPPGDDWAPPRTG